MSTNRRCVIAGSIGAAAAIAVAPAAMGAGNPDAELVALCREFNALEARYRTGFAVQCRTAEEEDKRDEKLTPLRVAQEALLARIADPAMVATSFVGIRARLETLLRYGPECLEEPRGWDDEMIGPLLIDLARIMKVYAS